MAQNHRQCWLAAALLVLATFAVYANSLAAPFIFDDAPAIVENPSIRHLFPLGAVLSPPATGSTAGRPLANLSFALNYAAGGLDPRGYHAVNLLLHALAALVLLGVARRTLLQPALRGRYDRDALPLAAMSALLWTVHPLLTESVTCMVHRTELLGGLFYLLTLYCAIRAMSDGAPFRWSVGAVAACLAGVASKEFVATVPLVALVYDRSFVAGTFREAWRRRGRLYLSLAGTWLLLGWLMVSSNQRGGTVGFGLGVSPWDYLLTQCQALVLYLRLAAWPHPLVLDYGTDLVQHAGEVLPQATLLLGLAGATLYALGRRRAAGFAGFCFFAILAPSSSFVPLTSQPIAEHRMYLPLAAVVTLGVLALHARLGRRGLGVGIGLAAVCGILTVQRNADYGSALSIWTITVAQRPANSRAHMQLAQGLDEAGRRDDALEEYRAAARLAPHFALPYFNLGLALLRAGHTDEAGGAFGDAVRLKPDYAEAHYNLANLLAQTGRPADALAHYTAAQGQLAGNADLHFNWGLVLYSLGRYPEAADQFSEAVRLAPGDPEAARNLAAARQAAGRR